MVAANALIGKACATGPRVVDRIRVWGPEQVILKVVVAEVNRNAAMRACSCFDFSKRTLCMDKAQVRRYRRFSG